MTIDHVFGSTEIPAMPEGVASASGTLTGVGAEFASAAPANRQAWIPIVDGAIAPLAADAPLAATWAGRPAADLLAAAAAER